MSSDLVSISKSTHDWLLWEGQLEYIEKSLAGTLKATTKAQKAATGEGSDLLLEEALKNKKRIPVGTDFSPLKRGAAVAGGVGALGALGAGGALAGRHIARNRAAVQQAAKRRKILIGAGAGAAGLGGASLLANRD